MPSRYEEKLRELAMEDDPDRRLEIASSIDSDADELTERWDSRDEHIRLETKLQEKEQDFAAVAAERDQWKQKYADRFFDPGEGDTNANKAISAHEADIKQESRPLGYEALWGLRDK